MDFLRFDRTPVLAGAACSVFFKKGDVAEIAVDGFALPPPVRAGLHSLQDRLGAADVDLAFCVEARAKDELPERLLACVRLRGVGGAAVEVAWP